VVANIWGCDTLIRLSWTTGIVSILHNLIATATAATSADTPEELGSEGEENTDKHEDVDLSIDGAADTKSVKSCIEGFGEGDVERNVDDRSGEQGEGCKGGDNGGHTGTPAGEKAKEAENEFDPRGADAKDEADVLRAGERSDSLEEVIDRAWEGYVLVVIRLLIDDINNVEHEGAGWLGALHNVPVSGGVIVSA